MGDSSLTAACASLYFWAGTSGLNGFKRGGTRVLSTLISYLTADVHRLPVCRWKQMMSKQQNGG